MDAAEQQALDLVLSGRVRRAFDIGEEDASLRERYGPGWGEQALLARRLVEAGVRYVSLNTGYFDDHSNIEPALKDKLPRHDRAVGVLIQDLAARGMLDDTLVVWGGEFGRTIYSQGTLTETNYGRDHHPRCFTTLVTGAGIKPGLTWGTTDDYSYNIVTPNEKVHVHDLNATILHLMGIDHLRLTFPYQGRDFRLTDVHGELVKGILA
jgi:hypothetical protein